MSPTKTRMSAARFVERWEEAQMDIANLLSQTVETQQKLHVLMGIHADLYVGVLGEEAPEIEIRGTVVKAS